MKSRSPFLAAVAAFAILGISATVAAAQESTLDHQSLYASRSGFVEVPIDGIMISHSEGIVSITRVRESEVSEFLVLQEFQSSGEVHFVGCVTPCSAEDIEQIFGTLMILPDGSLHVEYDAWNATLENASGSVTKFEHSETIVVVKKVCRCEDPNVGGCSPGPCNNQTACTQSTSIPREKCGWFDGEILVLASPTP